MRSEFLHAYILEQQIRLECYNGESQENRIVKISRDQPWRVWAFVIGLNLVGFIGWYLIQGYDLHQ